MSSLISTTGAALFTVLVTVASAIGIFLVGRKSLNEAAQQNIATIIESYKEVAAVQKLQIEQLETKVDNLSLEIAILTRENKALRAIIRGDVPNEWADS